MMTSVPYDAYDAHPSTPNGQTLMLPPEGTVPVGYEPDVYGPEEPEAIRAGEELINPIEPSPEALDRGQRVFETICFVCHGPEGEGNGPIIGRFPNPASLLSEHARSYPDGRIFHVITHGQGLMPSHAVQVLPADRWKVILHVRRLQAASLPEGGSP
jgi:mono/diheme cytochrome c family protein